MYQAPDFVKVNVSVKDVFAGYNNACPPIDSSTLTVYNGVSCAIGDPENYTYQIVMGYDYMCYQDLNG